MNTADDDDDNDDDDNDDYDDDDDGVCRDVLADLLDMTGSSRLRNQKDQFYDVRLIWTLSGFNMIWLFGRLSLTWIVLNIQEGGCASSFNSTRASSRLAENFHLSISSF